MRIHEKRTSPRYAIKVLVRFHCIEEGSADSEIVSQTANISNSGLFLYSTIRLRVGVPLSLTLRVPTSVTDSARSHIQCLGHIVHAQPVARDQIGYGVQFDNFCPFRQPTSVAVHI